MRLNNIAGNLFELSHRACPQQLAEILFYRGCDAEGVGDVASAQTFYVQAIQAVKTCKEAWLNLGTIQFQSGGFGRAEYCYRQALAADSGYCLARYNLANCLQEVGRFTEAKEEYERVLGDYPDCFDALFNLAYMLLFDFGDTRRSMHLVSRCEKLQPQDPHLKALKRFLARCHRNKGWRILA